MKQVSINQAFDAYLQVEEAKARAQRQEDRVKCVSLKELTDHVFSKAPLRTEQHAHVLKCHMCQISSRQLEISAGRQAAALSQSVRDRLSQWDGATASSKIRILPAILASDGDSPPE